MFRQKEIADQESAKEMLLLPKAPAAIWIPGSSIHLLDTGHPRGLPMPQTLWVFLLTIQAPASHQAAGNEPQDRSYSPELKEAHHLQSCTAAIAADSIHNGLVVREHQC